MAQDRVWYVAYGSNLSSRRLARYLDRAPIPDDGHVPPTATVSTTLDHRLFFAYESRLWTGGSAFIDPSSTVEDDHASMVRAWLIAEDQLWSVLAQENRRTAVTADRDWLSLAPGEHADALEGRYGRLLGCPSPDGRPCLTFTTPDDPLPPETKPSRRYVDTIVEGLCEGHGVSDEEARAYVAARIVS